MTCCQERCCEVGHDLHKANRLAHEVARTVVRLLTSRGYEHVKAWRELQELAAKYEKAMEAVDA